MRKIVVLTVFALAGFVGAAQASKPAHPAHPAHMAHPKVKPHEPKRCDARAVGYHASGTLLSSSLAPSAHKGKYSGTIEVNVTRANHRAATGHQTFTVLDVRVVFHHGVDAGAPAVGSRVGLHGKITTLPKGCSTKDFSPTITLHKIDIRKAKKVKP